MTVKLFMSLIIIIIIGFIIWFGIIKIPWVQEHRFLFWVTTIVIITFVGFVLFFVSIFGWRSRALPYPEIIYGEFPFKLEYEIDGVHFVIEDTLIAEFIESRRGSAMTPSRRMWRTTLQNSGEELRFLLIETNDVTIYFTVGRASYFMGDRNAHDVTIVPNPVISIQPRIVITGSQGLFERVYKNSEDAHKILVEYGITLISWEHEPPIRNSFR